MRTLPALLCSCCYLLNPRHMLCASAYCDAAAAQRAGRAHLVRARPALRERPQVGRAPEDQRGLPERPQGDRAGCTSCPLLSSTPSYTYSYKRAHLTHLSSQSVPPVRQDALPGGAAEGGRGGEHSREAHRRDEEADGARARRRDQIPVRFQLELIRRWRSELSRSLARIGSIAPTSAYVLE